MNPVGAGGEDEPNGACMDHEGRQRLGAKWLRCLDTASFGPFKQRSNMLFSGKNDVQNQHQQAVSHGGFHRRVGLYVITPTYSPSSRRGFKPKPRPTFRTQAEKVVSLFLNFPQATTQEKDHTSTLSPFRKRRAPCYVPNKIQRENRRTHLLPILSCSDAHTNPACYTHALHTVHDEEEHERPAHSRI